MCLKYVLFFVLTSASCLFGQHWDSPSLPPNFDILTQHSPSEEIENYPFQMSWLEWIFGKAVVVDKKIPRNLWIAFKEFPTKSTLSIHLQLLFSRASRSRWKIHLMDDTRIDHFMLKYYPDTAVLWAFQKVHPGAKIAAIDIWRYAALYAFGGFYMDDDADMLYSLESVSIGMPVVANFFDWSIFFRRCSLTDCQAG